MKAVQVTLARWHDKVLCFLDRIMNAPDYYEDNHYPPQDAPPVINVSVEVKLPACPAAKDKEVK